MEYIDHLHYELLDIMDYIHKVCEKNNIRYYLVGGSLLGAIRHKGFIPWDDDFDIGMPREDFERFIRLSDTELNNGMGLLWKSTYQEYWYPFAKVHNSNSTFVESTYESVKEKTGIYVDIFPIDTVASCTQEVIKRKEKIRLINRIMKDKILQNKPGSFKSCLLSLYSSTQSIQKWNDKQEKLMKKTNSAGGNYSANFASYYDIQKQCMPWDWYGSGKLAKFEDREYIIPVEPLRVLESIYGSRYMELPPVEKRRTHYPSFVKFTDGTEMKF